MQIVYERCAAVDVGKDMIAVAVRLPGDGPDGWATGQADLQDVYGMLGEAARWLTSLGVTHVAMEAKIHSMPVYHALVEHGDFAQVLVCNAGHVKNVPGRKKISRDADWLVHLLECGLLAGSFIPPAGIKAARDVIRYRAKVVHLARHGHRHTLRRARRGLLHHPPGTRTRNPPPGRQARGPRPRRHPGTSRRLTNRRRTRLG